MNISTILDMAAETYGDRTALVHGDQRLSYAALRDAAQRASGHIAASQAQHLALLDIGGLAAPIALFAAAYAGKPYVPLNYRLTASEITALLQRISPAYVVAADEYAQLAGAVNGLEVIARDAFIHGEFDAGSTAPQAEEDPRAIAVQLFTSGTTGAPKAAILRHENLMSYILGTVEFASAEASDAALVAVPPYHIAGISALLSSIYAGRRIVFVPQFDAASWLDWARQEAVSNAFLVPTMLQRLVDLLDQNNQTPALPSLRALAYGGGKMPRATIERAMALFPGVDFTNAYGLTETSSTISVLGPDDHRVAAASEEKKIRHRLASVGRATEAVEIQIRDESDQVLSDEEVGMVFVRGPQVSGEYLSLGSQLDSDGWFPTRDRGYLDAEGYLFLDGRADDVIVRGGENISPGEIEDVLMSHPDVEDAAVVGVPDAQWGEAVAAAIVCRPGSAVAVDVLQNWVKKRLRSSRVPQSIIFKTELPYNEIGKVLRRVIKLEMGGTKHGV